MKKFFVEIWGSLRSHDLINLSANISFFAILSLLPIMMIFIAVLGYFMGSGEIVNEIADRFTDVVPGASEIILSNLQNFTKSSQSVGFWGLGFLLLVSTVLFSSIERAFNIIFESSKKRNFIISKLLAIAVIFIILVMLALPSAITLLETFVARYGFAFPLNTYISDKIFFGIFAVVAYVVTVVIVTNHRVYFRYAFIGGLLFAIGLACARILFQWYLQLSFDRYNVVYGSLTAIVLTTIWIYYLVYILLLSSEVVAFLQRRRKK